MDYFYLGDNQDLLRTMITSTLAIEDVEDESTEIDPRMASIVAKVDHNIFEYIRSTTNVMAVRRQARMKLGFRMVAAAAAIALAVVGIYFYTYHQQTIVQDVAVHTADDVAPGDFGATLTLANGKKIRLADVSNGELVKESGISISKTADGKLVYEIEESASNTNAVNTLSTANGETYQVHLPDGSLVYLNAASSLSYKTSLVEGGRRVVSLRGEGYFEIAKDKAHPFIVKTDREEVEVLGTHFNISSYADEEQEKTTLLEGSIKLSAFGGSRVLKPGQQANVLNGKIHISEVDTDLAVAWKNNEFVVESERIETIMKMVERWYNVEVIYVGTPTNERFSGGVSRFDKVSRVLDIVESTGAAHFEIKGRKIYVSK